MSETPTNEAVDDTATIESTEREPEFDANYVAKLRQEAADNRIKAKRADDLARQVVRAMARADGRLIDADDLAFDVTYIDEDGMVDSDRVVAAIDALVERKPHLAARRPIGAMAQGARPESDGVTLLGMLNSLG
jgi:hypothetical protein